MHVTFQELGRRGRLGNQLFQIATTIGIARRNRCKFIFPKWKYSHFFAHPLPQADEVTFEQTYYEQHFCYYPVEIQTSANLSGYFQSEKYFKECEDEIRRYFTPNEKLAAMVAEEQEFLSAQVDVGKTCSVCVRRGDYVGNGYFQELAKTSYYVNAFRQFDPQTEFLVFSDEIDWCRTYFKQECYRPYRFTFANPVHKLSGLFLMASCRNHIIANSTYPWWGAWLNSSKNKRVIAPDTWFDGFITTQGKAYTEGGFHDTKDLIPESWEKIPVHFGELSGVPHV
ncbi:MAG: alpha-1,2-fucosyltransferase [Planctomycetaceae bacterium]|jgi:hypothetical protein|nr:alpha-1,2-fucosyltransferase [Planctomycetaceae bacterium]